MNKKKITKVFLIAGLVDMFYGHFYAVWRNVSPDTFDLFFEQKNNLYSITGIDKLWKK